MTKADRSERKPKEANGSARRAASAVLLQLAFVGFCSLLFASTAVAEEIPKEMNGLPLLFSEDFSSGTAHWDFTDAKVWRIADQDGNKILEQTGQSDYKPPHRSPLNLAFIKDLVVSDFVLEFRVQSTGQDVPHRDAVAAWGWQDPAHFYYAHISRDADAVAHNIHVVDGADRRPVTANRNTGVKWDDGWHKIRIIRNDRDIHEISGEGKLERAGHQTVFQVFYDSLEKAALSAVDDRFGPGRLGLGSFDDTVRIDDVRVWGKIGGGETPPLPR